METWELRWHRPASTSEQHPCIGTRLHSLMPTFSTRRPEGTDVSSSIPPRSGTSIKAIAVSLLASGGVLILLALFADTLHIGGGRGFGYQQMIVLIVGLVLALGGVALISQSWLNRMMRD